MDDTNNQDDEEEISSADNDLVILKVGIYILKEWRKSEKKRIFRFLGACYLKVNSLYYWEISISIKQPWELGKKYNSNFIFTFVVVNVRYDIITMAKIFKHGNYLK